ncbi:response regulator [Synoicihabitans lomoniglobus]|uniref:Response regulator n=1 Tax=Synoicihabitans lomoniglobus TaxID=2909285 RepID=A0AAF0A0U4_9BACT|nr:response regulator [Opitutaceae bacterium LMO-M01]WED65278.1 response regulator [Opitutaceae bacterium LMO-M01]
MQILAVEDDPVARRVLRQALKKLGHEVIEAEDGEAGLDALEREKVRVIVCDWIMPQMDGLEFCRRVRDRPAEDYVYFILLTSRTASTENEREAADAGVDDFLSKPLDVNELWMRLRVAERILQFATQVRTLEAFLPICSYCKKVREDSNYWTQIESYINTRTGTDFSHSVCPDCYQSVVVPELNKLKAEAAAQREADAEEARSMSKSDAEKV